jgi:hypothetical protein
MTTEDYEPICFLRAELGLPKGSPTLVKRYSCSDMQVGILYWFKALTFDTNHRLQFGDFPGQTCPVRYIYHGTDIFIG